MIMSRRSCLIFVPFPRAMKASPPPPPPPHNIRYRIFPPCSRTFSFFFEILFSFFSVPPIFWVVFLIDALPLQPPPFIPLFLQIFLPLHTLEFVLHSFFSPPLELSYYLLLPTFSPRHILVTNSKFRVLRLASPLPEVLFHRFFPPLCPSPSATDIVLSFRSSLTEDLLIFQRFLPFVAQSDPRCIPFFNFLLRIPIAGAHPSPCGGVIFGHPQASVTVSSLSLVLPPLFLDLKIKLTTG